MTNPTQAEVPAGMKAYGPAHPDYPNPPRDHARLGLPVRRSGASAVGLDWRHHAPDHPRYPHDIVAYPATPSTSVQGAGEAGYSEQALADRHIDFLEDRADAWMADSGVQRMFNAIASVFEKYAPQEVMDRFREKLSVIGRQCHVEGALRVWEEIAEQQRALGRPLPADPAALSTPPAPASVADEASYSDQLRQAIDAGLKAFCTDTPDFDMSLAMRRAAADFILGQPLAFAPRPAGEGVRETAQFLSDRLDQLEWMDDDLAASCRDYFGHVEPAHERLRAALATEGTPS